jgi:hypothetical protein
MPEDGYSGAYIQEIAAAVLRRQPGVLELPEAEALAAFRAEGTARRSRNGDHAGPLLGWSTALGPDHRSRT